MQLTLNGKVPPEAWRLLLVIVLVCGGLKGGDLLGLVL